MIQAGEEARFTNGISCSFGKDNQECSDCFRIDAHKLLRGTEDSCLETALCFIMTMFTLSISPPFHTSFMISDI
jgi:hypothetical protein